MTTSEDNPHLDHYLSIWAYNTAIRVTEAEAHNIERQYEADIACMIRFIDLFGSPHTKPRTDFHGTYRTNPAIRAADAALDAALEAEEGDEEPWRDDR